MNSLEVRSWLIVLLFGKIILIISQKIWVKETEEWAPSKAFCSVFPDIILIKNRPSLCNPCMWSTKKTPKWLTSLSSDLRSTSIVRQHFLPSLYQHFPAHRILGISFHFYFFFLQFLVDSLPKGNRNKTFSEVCWGGSPSWAEETIRKHTPSCGPETMSSADVLEQDVVMIAGTTNLCNINFPTVSSSTLCIQPAYVYIL